MAAAGTFFKTFGSKETKNLIENVEMLKTTSSTTIGPRVEPAGFTEIKTQVLEITGGIRIERIPALVGIHLGNPIFSEMSADVRQEVAREIGAYVICEMDMASSIKYVDINFVNSGWINLLQMSFAPIHDRPGIMRYAYRVARATFTPARPYVVVTHSKSNIWGSRSESTITYLPAVVTTDHIRAVTDITLGLIADCNIHMPLIEDAPATAH